jgi:predicted mannosyl-3-phosphoglycerate phosphatase (HAD superfamily)
MKFNMFEKFNELTITELENCLCNSKTRDEVLFYQKLLALKLGLAQEKVVGRELL